MKKFSFLLLFLTSFSSFSASEHTIWMKPSITLKTYFIKASDNNQLQNNNPQHAFYSLKKIKQNEESTHHIRYNQYYKKIPIWGHQLIAHKQKNNLSLITGVFVDGIEDDIPDNQAILSEEDATRPILSTCQHLIKAKNIRHIIYINDDDKKAYQAYSLSFYSQDENGEPTNPHYIINASNGKVIKQWDEIKTLIKGEGFGGNSIALPYRKGKFQYGKSKKGVPSLGSFSLDKWSFWCYFQTPDFRVISFNNAWLSANDIPYVFPIYDSEEKEYNINAVYDVCWPWTTVYNNSNDQGDSPIYGSYSPINDAMYFTQETLKMYQDFGFAYPLGKTDLPLRVFTHISGFDNAFALPTIYETNSKGQKTIKSHQQIVLSNGAYYFTALTQSVIPHELSHNFTRLNSSLVYKDESGAINEAFSDMAAITLMDKIRQHHSFYWDGEDWSIGRESSEDGMPIRYFEHPSLDGHSIEHLNEYKKTLNVHYASGLFNRAFYLLAHEPEWSIHDAFQVMVNANANYWSSDTTFNHAACGVIQSARDLKRDPDAVIDAFAQVGVVCSEE